MFGKLFRNITIERVGDEPMAYVPKGKRVFDVPQVPQQGAG